MNEFAEGRDCVQPFTAPNVRRLKEEMPRAWKIRALAWHPCKERINCLIDENEQFLSCSDFKSCRTLKKLFVDNI
jgi:hypothetical protein